MTINNESAYRSSWTELRESTVPDGTVTGSYRLNRIFLANNEASHFVYIGLQICHTNSQSSGVNIVACLR
jgi:hypothetical protein